MDIYSSHVRSTFK